MAAKKILLACLCLGLMGLLLFSSAALALTYTPDPAGNVGNPTKFIVTVTKVVLNASDGSTVTIFSGSKQLDLANLAPGALESFVTGVSVPANTYTSATISLANSFTFFATIIYTGGGTGSYNGVPAGGVPGPLVNGRTYCTTSTGSAASGLASDISNFGCGNFTDSLPADNKTINLNFSSPLTIEGGETKSISIKMDNLSMAIFYRAITDANEKVMVIAPKKWTNATATVTTD